MRGIVWMTEENKAAVHRRFRQKALEEIRKIISENRALEEAVLEFQDGDVIFHENEALEQLMFLLEGSLILQKESPEGTPVTVDRLRAGDLVGILSFESRAEAYVSAHATSPGKALIFSWSQYEELHASFPELHHLLREVTVENLSQRYRRMVGLHVDLASLNLRLENERNELRRTIDELERTRNRLIHQEKLATLGQFMAGVAHEINNPASALIRSAEYLEESVSALVRKSEQEALSGVRLWELGLKSDAPDTAERRKRMELLSRRFPDLPRSLLRRLSALPEEALEVLDRNLSRRARSDPEQVHSILVYFESGSSLKTLQIAAERISRLVVSLKNYIRPGGPVYEPVDVRQGLRDTLFIVGNRLKSFAVELHLDDVPPVAGEAGELNQVWTNLIINACDAMGESGRLILSCGLEDKDKVFVSIGDTGPGVPDQLREKIFDTNFTTKTRGQSYGLGLGLAISREIVSKHGGVLSVANRPQGGAEFKVVLLVAEGR
ncbi:MAG: ATP-binding protein [Opitutales bacterium]